MSGIRVEGVGAMIHQTKGSNGSIDGWAFTCPCGLKMTTSLSVEALRADIAEHDRWHQQKAAARPARRRRSR